MRKEFALTAIALVLALVAVESASFLQNPPAGALMKDASVPETNVHLQIDQSNPLVTLDQTVIWVVLVPLAMAWLCYLFVRRRS
jgi:hypothetical protein